MSSNTMPTSHDEPLMQHAQAAALPAPGGMHVSRKTSATLAKVYNALTLALFFAVGAAVFSLID